jgi:hypothetical protein
LGGERAGHREDATSRSGAADRNGSSAIFKKPFGAPSDTTIGGNTMGMAKLNVWVSAREE